ncbi:MAG: substrate-binding domain-containing protein [Acidobacteriia bacterium]|nr:substrate-binding domain-containing protein [Terriglobia bacterium]
MRPIAISVLAALLLLPASHAADSLILATTTSTQDSGLLDVLIPAFEARFPIKVKTIAVGSGEAIAMGRRGDADVLLVHSKAAEDAFMAEGLGSLRLDVMYNDFLVVGPPADPAGAKGLEAAEALEKIAAARATFVSRGDQSGTHVKELALWKKTGVDPAGKDWYVSTGQGMGETARIASEKRAYTLIDRGTYLAMKAKLDLAPVAEGDEDLLNSYRVIVVDPEKHPKTHAAAARRFAEWLVSPGTQKMIGEFGRERYGRSLFVPDAK